MFPSRGVIPAVPLASRLLPNASFTSDEVETEQCMRVKNIGSRET
jgi:hypothetical protein